MMKCVYGFLLLLLVTSAHASVDTLSVFSTQMNKPVKVLVITPDKMEGTRLPVVYLLHGFGGNYSSWLKDAPQIKQKANEMQAIIVLPDGGYGSWYFDSPVDATIRYESFMIKELLPYIDAHYPTKNNKAFRAITGLSMGGHGAFYLAIRHKDLFGAAGSVCGGVDFRPFPKNWDLAKALGPLDTHAENWNTNTVINQIDSLRSGDIQLIFDCGVGDFFLTVNRALHQKLLSKNVAHDYTERPGAHNSAYWRNSIDYQLLFFKNWFAAN
jgi:S-formylglutathione hydrolase FrmB